MGRGSYQYLPLSEGKHNALKKGEIDSGDRYEIRQRIQHTLSNGHLIWHGLGKDAPTFEPVGGPRETKQLIDETEISEAKRLRQGVIGWLAFLYSGIEKADNVYLDRERKFEITDSLDQVNQVPTIHFDFETLLYEAIGKAENKQGRRVTEISLNIETEPIPSDPWEDLNTGELLPRFEERDPTLTSREIAYLQYEGLIDGEDWEQYNGEAYTSPTERGGGMLGESEFPDSPEPDGS